MYRIVQYVECPKTNFSIEPVPLRKSWFWDTQHTKPFTIQIVNINSILDGTFASISYNSADLNIIAIIDANFSQVNRDIVYYVVYTDKIKPFNMNIVRVKK